MRVLRIVALIFLAFMSSVGMSKADEKSGGMCRKEAGLQFETCSNQCRDTFKLARAACAGSNAECVKSCLDARETCLQGVRGSVRDCKEECKSDLEATQSSCREQCLSEGVGKGKFKGCMSNCLATPFGEAAKCRFTCERGFFNSDENKSAIAVCATNFRDCRKACESSVLGTPTPTATETPAATETPTAP